MAAWIVLSICIIAAWSARTVAPESATTDARPPGRVERFLESLAARWPARLDRTRLKRLVVLVGPGSLALAVSILYLFFARSANPDIPVPLLLSLVALAAAFGGLIAGGITAFVVTFGFGAVSQTSTGLVSLGMASAVIAIAVGTLWGNASRADASLRTANERIHRFAFRDPLTGLLDRRGFEAVVQAEIARYGRRGGQMTILLLEIDQAELRHRRLRRSLADTVVQSLAEAIDQHTRESDTAGRVDTDEFAICLSDAAPPAAELARDRINAAYRKNLVDYLPGVAPVTIRTGIVAFPGEAMTPADLLAAAERDIEANR